MHGKPCGTELTQEHIAVFTKGGFAIPADYLVVLYSKIHFRSTGRIVKTKRKLHKGLLRNNSGIVFCDQAGMTCYEELLLVVLCENHDAYAIVLPFIPTGEILSNDSVIDCSIDQHITKAKSAVHLT